MQTWCSFCKLWSNIQWKKDTKVAIFPVRVAEAPIQAELHRYPSLQLPSSVSGSMRCSQPVRVLCAAQVILSVGLPLKWGSFSTFSSHFCCTSSWLRIPKTLRLESGLRLRAHLVFGLIAVEPWPGNLEQPITLWKSTVDQAVFRDLVLDYWFLLLSFVFLVYIIPLFLCTSHKLFKTYFKWLNYYYWCLFLSETNSDANPIAALCFTSDSYYLP